MLLGFVDAKWLVDHVQDLQLRIIDATVIFDPASWEANSGRAGREAWLDAGGPVSTEVVSAPGARFVARRDRGSVAAPGIDAALYDGSLVEWVADESLPMETG